MKEEMKSVYVIEDVCLNISKKPEEFFEFFQKLFDKCPKEYRDTLTIECCPMWVYDNEYTGWNISYLRPLTNEEKDESKREKERYEAEELKRAEMQFEELKKKLGK